MAAALLLFAGLRNVNWSSLTGFECTKLIWAGVALVVAVGLFYRYLKFFKHYTEEVVRDYAESSEDKTIAGGRKRNQQRDEE